jgi:hypothetical protein
VTGAVSLQQLFGFMVTVSAPFAEQTLMNAAVEKIVNNTPAIYLLLKK